MTKGILLSDVEFAERLIKAGCGDSEISEALQRRGVESSSALKVIGYLRAGLPVRPELVVPLIPPGSGLRHRRHSSGQCGRILRDAAKGFLILCLFIAGTAYFFSNMTPIWSGPGHGDSPKVWDDKPAFTNKFEETPRRR